MATLMIILLLGQWNDIIWPSVTLTSDKGYTVTLGIFSLAKAVFGGASLGQTQWGVHVCRLCHLFAAARVRVHSGAQGVHTRSVERGAQVLNWYVPW